MSRSCLMGGHATRGRALRDGPSNSFSVDNAFKLLKIKINDTQRRLSIAVAVRKKP